MATSISEADSLARSPNKMKSVCELDGPERKFNCGPSFNTRRMIGLGPGPT